MMHFSLLGSIFVFLIVANWFANKRQQREAEVIEARELRETLRNRVDHWLILNRAFQDQFLQDFSCKKNVEKVNWKEEGF